MSIPYVWLGVTVLLFALGDWLYRRSGGRVWFHPILLPTVLLVLLFLLKPGLFAAFEQDTNVLYAGLLAAVAALAVPLYRNLGVLRQEKAAVAAAIIGGSVAGVTSALGIIAILSADDALYGAMVSKSVTTPIAISIADGIGASASLSAAIVIVTGLFAAIFGPPILAKCGIDDDVGMGLALGTAGHAIGMAEAVRRSDVMGAAAAFAMAANGLATAVIVPLVWPLL